MVNLVHFGTFYFSYLSLVAAFVASYLTHRFVVAQRENERRNILRTWLLVIIQELKKAQEVFESYEDAHGRGLKADLLTVEATGYEGLKTNGLVDMLPGELHYKIYNFYLTLTSINSSADLLNQAYLLGKPNDELSNFRNIVISYYKLGLQEIELRQELERFTIELRKPSVLCLCFEMKTWEELHNKILFRKSS
jgi:hypothetical protein